jgi:transposase
MPPTGWAGLEDQPRSGRPNTVRRERRAEIVALTQQPPPQQLGITHWSTRTLAKRLGDQSHDRRAGTGRA